MERRIKVHILGREEVEEVTPQEAERILENIHNDPVGGLVVDVKTGKVIWRIGPEVEEIKILEQWLGGG
jgi:hypothetical protein